VNLNDRASPLEVLIMVIGFLFVVFASGRVGYELNIGDYRRGQIDALTGKVKYELRENEMGERVWVEKGGADGDVE
jgi:hypothetical protein